MIVLDKVDDLAYQALSEICIKRMKVRDPKFVLGLRYCNEN